MARAVANGWSFDSIVGMAGPGERSGTGASGHLGQERLQLRFAEMRLRHEPEPGSRHARACERDEASALGVAPKGTSSATRPFGATTIAVRGFSAIAASTSRLEINSPSPRPFGWRYSRLHQAARIRPRGDVMSRTSCGRLPKSGIPSPMRTGTRVTIEPVDEARAQEALDRDAAVHVQVPGAARGQALHDLRGLAAHLLDDASACDRHRQVERAAAEDDDALRPKGQASNERTISKVFRPMTIVSTLAMNSS